MPKKMSDLAMNSHVQLGIMPKLSIMPNLGIMPKLSIMPNLSIMPTLNIMLNSKICLNIECINNKTFKLHKKMSDLFVFQFD